MPLGNTRRPQIGEPVHQVIPVPPAAVAPLPPSLVERQAGGDMWKHVTLDTAAATWSGGLAQVDFSKEGRAREITVYAPTGVVLYIAFDKPASTSAGTYDIFHPGGGFLSERCPDVGVLYLATVSGSPPPAPIEVFGRAGAYMLR